MEVRRFQFLSQYIEYYSQLFQFIHVDCDTLTSSTEKKTKQNKFNFITIRLKNEKIS